MSCRSYTTVATSLTSLTRSQKGNLPEDVQRIRLHAAWLNPACQQQLLSGAGSCAAGLANDRSSSGSIGRGGGCEPAATFEQVLALQMQEDPSLEQFVRSNVTRLWAGVHPGASETHMPPPGLPSLSPPFAGGKADVAPDTLHVRAWAMKLNLACDCLHIC